MIWLIASLFGYEQEPFSGQFMSSYIYCKYIDINNNVHTLFVSIVICISYWIFHLYQLTNIRVSYRDKFFFSHWPMLNRELPLVKFYVKPDTYRLYRSINNSLSNWTNITVTILILRTYRNSQLIQTSYIDDR